MKHSLAVCLSLRNLWRGFTCISLWIVLIGAVAVPQVVNAQQNVTVTITTDNAYVFGFGTISGITSPSTYFSPGVANL